MQLQSKNAVLHFLSAEMEFEKDIQPLETESGMRYTEGDIHAKVAVRYYDETAGRVYVYRFDASTKEPAPHLAVRTEHIPTEDDRAYLNALKENGIRQVNISGEAVE